LPSLGWDSTVARLYALRADDPSSNKRGSVPAANWLGLVGLSYLPVYPWRGRLMTTGVDGRWKGATFRWPVWVAPSTSATLASLLRTDWRSHPTQALEAVGIAAVAACKILRSDQGGYGSFSPSVVEANRSM
jgi:hypothetical protein